MKFIECEKKVEKKEILSLLEKFNIDANILSELLEHYEHCNGGYPEQEDAVVLDSKSMYPFSGFIAFKYGDLKIEIYLEDLKEFGLNINTYEYLPFAICEGAGVFCLNLKKKGKVVLFIEEENRFWDIAWKSFSAFKESIYSEETLYALSENEKNLLKNKIISLTTSYSSENKYLS